MNSMNSMKDSRVSKNSNCAPGRTLRVSHRTSGSLKSSQALRAFRGALRIPKGPSKVLRGLSESLMDFQGLSGSIRISKGLSGVLRGL